MRHATSMFAKTWVDFFVGLGLFLYGSVGLAFYVVVGVALFKLSENIAGFRILFSDALANWGQLAVFSLWPGIIIMLGRTLLPRMVVAVLNDGFWFCMSEHYILIAFSRYVAIAHPFWFQARFRKYAYPICMGGWVFAFCQSLLMRVMPWKTTFYYNVTMYGFVNAEWGKYHAFEVDFWNAYNTPVVCGPLVFYVMAVWVIWRGRRSVSSGSRASNDNDKTERRLLVPCFINQSCYFVGSQLLFAFLLQIGGKWGSLAMHIYFTTNSLVNPVMLVIMSPMIRNKALALIGIKPPPRGANAASSAATTSKTNTKWARRSPSPRVSPQKISESVSARKIEEDE